MLRTLQTMKIWKVNNKTLEMKNLATESREDDNNVETATQDENSPSNAGLSDEESPSSSPVFENVEESEDKEENVANIANPLTRCDNSVSQNLTVTQLNLPTTGALQRYIKQIFVIFCTLIFYGYKMIILCFCV